MKKLINDPADVVSDALLGIEAAHPDLRVDHANKIIYRGDAPRPGKPKSYDEQVQVRIGVDPISWTRNP